MIEIIEYLKHSRLYMVDVNGKTELLTKEELAEVIYKEEQNGIE